tara:strand:- start:144 stop:512 length:369 start_codon:yes stop_codon:yes gene_type:complete
MPKKKLILRDFSGGLSTVRDPRDINVKEFSSLKNFYVDQLGALRPSGSLIAHAGGGSEKNISSMGSAIISSSGGRNLFYFESDHDISGAAAITSSSGNPIKFYNVAGQIGGATAPPPENLAL